MPFILLFNKMLDLAINMILSPLVYYPIVSLMKVNYYWYERVIYGLPSYLYAVVDSIVISIFQAMHASLSYSSHYTLRTGMLLRDDEFEHLARSFMSLFIWMTIPLRRDVYIHNVSYDPYKIDKNKNFTIKMSGHDTFELLAYNSNLISLKNLTIRSTSINNDFVLNANDINVGNVVILDGYPDTRCAAYCWGFGYSTFPYNIPTCRAINTAAVDDKNRSISNKLINETVKYLKKGGFDVNKIMERLKNISDKKDKKDVKTVIDRLGYGAKDKDLSFTIDNFVFYCWYCAKSSPLTTSVVSGFIEDFSELLKTTTLLTGRTIYDLIRSLVG